MKIGQTEERMKTVAESRKKRWCETLKNIDIRHDNRKSWRLIISLTNTPYRPQIQSQVISNRIAHTVLLNSKLHKINRII